MSRKIAIIIILTMFFLFILASVLIYNFLGTQNVSIDKNSYLVLPIFGDIKEYSTKKSIFNPNPPLTIWGIYNAVGKAKYDSRIKGIILKLYSPSIGMGKIDEIMDILKDFKASGKKIYAYIEYGSMKDYYLATVADKTYMIPTGTLILNGYSFEVMFYKNLLNKIGVKANLLHIGKYKTYSNTFTEDKMTSAHKEFMEDILNKYVDRFLTVVSNNRGINKNSVSKIIDRGIFTAKEAVDNKLIDYTGYYDELKTYIKKGNSKLIINNKINLVSYSNYFKNINTKRYNNIAIIFAMGQIQSGDSGYNPLLGDFMGSDTIINAIKKAKKDKSVKAIILRVNSPGGSGIASDKILRELLLASKLKPVIVSMSDLAASGGYWISMAAKEIIAQPLTLTGSIGVVAGKFSLKGLYNKIGISIDRVEYGKYSRMFTSTDDFTEDEKQLLFGYITDFYNSFLKVVAKGRNMKISDVDAIGRGRVWTGESALKLKLVDKLGGLITAIKEAKRIAKSKTLGIIVYPKKRSFLSDLGISSDIISKFTKIKKIKTIFPYKSFEPLAIMDFIPVLSDK
jgi:protease-4